MTGWPRPSGRTPRHSAYDLESLSGHYNFSQIVRYFCAGWVGWPGNFISLWGSFTAFSPKTLFSPAIVRSEPHDSNGRYNSTESGCFLRFVYICGGLIIFFLGWWIFLSIFLAYIINLTLLCKVGSTLNLKIICHETKDLLRIQFAHSDITFCLTAVAAVCRPCFVTTSMESGTVN